MANANFGALTDHFGAISTGLVLIGSSKTPVAKSVAEALDENGDVAEHTIYGAADIFDVSCEYEIHAASFDSGTLKLGEIVAGTAVSSITITTSNGAWPKVSISGRIGLETMLAPDGKANTYTLPSLTIIGAKAAQPLGFSVDGGSLSGSSIEASAEIAESADGLGVPAVHGISGAHGTLNASFVRTPDETPAWTLTLTGATSVQEPGSEQAQAAYHTASAQAKFIIARDASA